MSCYWQLKHHMTRCDMYTVHILNKVHFNNSMNYCMEYWILITNVFILYYICSSQLWLFIVVYFTQTRWYDSCRLLIGKSTYNQMIFTLKFSQCPRIVSEHFLDLKKIQKGPGMSYMVGKIFMYEISFNIAYNESGHKNININRLLFFLTEFRKKIYLLKKILRGRKQH